MDWSTLSDDEKARLVWEINQAIQDSPYSVEAKALEDYEDRFADYDGPDSADKYEWEKEMEVLGLDPRDYDFDYDWEHGTLGGKRLSSASKPFDPNDSPEERVRKARESTPGAKKAKLLGLDFDYSPYITEEYDPSLQAEFDQVVREKIKEQVAQKMAEEDAEYRRNHPPVDSFGLDDGPGDEGVDSNGNELEDEGEYGEDTDDELEDEYEDEYDEEEEEDDEEEEPDPPSDKKVKDKKSSKGCVSDETVKNIATALSDFLY